VALSVGATERFLADPEESGWRADDPVLAYTRSIPLPAEVTLSATGSVSAPLSFYSYRSGMITAPRLSIGAERTWAEYIHTGARLFGSYYIQQYTSPVNGTGPNPRARAGAAVDVSGDLPFHKPLSAGLTLYTGYGWYYQPHGAPPSNPGEFQGGVPDPQYPSQPMTQSYGGTVYVKYEFPRLRGVGSDLQIAYGQGDPTLGYTSTLHDGMSHLYLFYRQTSEVFASLTVNY
jgi:hypothetical protein